MIAVPLTRVRPLRRAIAVVVMENEIKPHPGGERGEPEEQWTHAQACTSRLNGWYRESAETADFAQQLERCLPAGERIHRPAEFELQRRSPPRWRL